MFWLGLIIGFVIGFIFAPVLVMLMLLHSMEKERFK